MPFRGSVLLFAAYAMLFLFVVLGLGVAISTVSQSQGEAIQLAIMTLAATNHAVRHDLPTGIDGRPGVRWIGSTVLPLTWFVVGMRGIFLKGTAVSALLFPSRSWV
ncbi:MAG: hypothetical protein R2710_03020 [Acidimicrobiales bacterium]